MNRNDWEAQVKASDLNPTARLVALVLGGFGNWTVDKTVEPGESRVAKEAGLDPSTVATYVDAFVEQGWLRPMGKGRYNTTIYELCEPDTPATGVLAKTKRKSNPKSTQNLRKGTPVVPERTGNIKIVGGGLVPDTTDFSSRKEDEMFPKESGVVPGTTETNLKNQHTNQEEPVASADAQANVYHFVVRDGSQSLPNSSNVANPVYLMDLEGVTGPLTTKDDGTSLTTSSRDAAVQEGVSRPNRILTPGERKAFEAMVRSYRVSEENAREALRIIEAGPYAQDINEAALGALQAVGAVSQEVEAW